MPRILLDQNAPVGLGKILQHHEVSSASELGWAELSNGELIAAAEKAGFDVMITADRNLRYQQNLSKRLIAVVVLGTNRWKTIEAHPEQVEDAIARCEQGRVSEVGFD